MPFYKVKWPDGEIELVEATGVADLFWLLDRKGDPCCAEIEEIELLWPEVKKTFWNTRTIRKITDDELNKAIEELYGFA